MAASMSRPRNPASEAVQLVVGEVPVDVVGMLDAVSLAEGEKSRGPLVIRILQQWAAKEARRHTLIARVLHSNQTISALASMADESRD